MAAKRAERFCWLAAPTCTQSLPTLPAGGAVLGLIGIAETVVIISVYRLSSRRVCVLGCTWRYECVMALALDNGLWYYMTDAGQQQTSLYTNSDPWSNTINVNQQVNANAVTSLFKYPRQPDPWATNTVSTLNTVATVSTLVFCFTQLFSSLIHAWYSCFPFPFLVLKHLSAIFKWITSDVYVT